MKEAPSILLVDDDVVFRERLARALTTRGCRVLTAGDPRGAAELWSASTFEGAVLDLRLVESSGLKLIPEFKARHPQARIVVLTGFGSIGTGMEVVVSGPRSTSRSRSTWIGCSPPSAANQVPRSRTPRDEPVCPHSKASSGSTISGCSPTAGATCPGRLGCWASTAGRSSASWPSTLRPDERLRQNAAPAAAFSRRQLCFHALLYLPKRPPTTL